MGTKKIDWLNVIFFPTYHILLLVLLPIYVIFFGLSLDMIVTTGILYILCELGITAGYHRLWSHRTYTAKKPLEIFLLIFGTLATQGSVFSWSYDHRLHHRFVDKEQDPYNVQKGFWHAHFLWLMRKRDKLDEKAIQDLAKNKLLVFQHKHYGKIWTILNILIIVSGLLFSNIVGAFVMLFLLRMFLVHHSTWFINSIAHYWGVQPYSKENSAVNNFIIAMLTLGEGYHNYHHTFAGDYRNGVRWYQFDPAKLFIWLTSKVKLASNLKKVNISIIRKRMLKEDKRLMLEKIENLRNLNSEEIRKKMLASYEELLLKLTEMSETLANYKEAKSKKIKAQIKEFRKQKKQLKKSIRREFRIWCRMCDNILKMPSAA